MQFARTFFQAPGQSVTGFVEIEERAIVTSIETPQLSKHFGVVGVGGQQSVVNLLCGAELN